jgi:hypothetical protein
MSAQPKDVSYIPPYYFVSQDEEQRLRSLSRKRAESRRGWRSLLSRRSAQR